MLRIVSSEELASAMLNPPGTLIPDIKRTGGAQHPAAARFVHAEAAGLRIGDIAELRAAYCGLLLPDAPFGYES